MVQSERRIQALHIGQRRRPAVSRKHRLFRLRIPLRRARTMSTIYPGPGSPILSCPSLRRQGPPALHVFWRRILLRRNACSACHRQRGLSAFDAPILKEHPSYSENLGTTGFPLCTLANRPSNCLSCYLDYLGKGHGNRCRAWFERSERFHGQFRNFEGTRLLIAEEPTKLTAVDSATIVFCCFRDMALKE